MYDRLGTVVIQPLSTPLARLVLALSLTVGALLSQTPPSTPSPAAPVAPPATANQPEMATKEAPAIFKTTFTKDNFQLSDKGKPQEISKFSVEKSGGKAPIPVQAETLPAAPGEDTLAPADIPERFVAYLFDDMHLPFGDLVRARDAAGRQLAGLPKTDRAAIYTTSGQNQLDFTGDVDKLQETLLRIRNRSISDPGGIPQCPDISYYMADQIVRGDAMAVSLAAQELMACTPGITLAQAQSFVQNAARNVLGPAEQETRVSLIVLKDVVRRMSVMPGQRIIVLISPGFLAPDQQQEKNDILDRAIHENVLINSLDARGLWVDPMVDVSRSGSTSTGSFGMLKRQYDRDSANAQADVLSEMAAGTGGIFFQNNNDLDAGLRQLVAAPEYYYVLGFSPQNLKLDGSFHGLKVTLKPPAGLAIQARKGYYAPRKLSNAAETAKQEIEEALFSREELSELPVELHTQFFKGEKDATLAVLCRVDPKHIQFRKADGRNNNSLTIVSGIFDRDGNFVSGVEKTVEMKLKDETLAKLLAAGTMSIKTNFSVAPGTYMVRLVVRDSEGQFMSAVNGAVAIQ
jgi:VWFA-related protein